MNHSLQIWIDVDVPICKVEDVNAWEVVSALAWKVAFALAWDVVAALAWEVVDALIPKWKWIKLKTFYTKKRIYYILLMKKSSGCSNTVIIIFIILIAIAAYFLFFANKKVNEQFKVVGGTPNCPYKTDESCPWVKQGTGPACQIKKDHAGCPACCGNIDWYLGPEKYKQKCPGKVPPAFTDAKDYYSTLQENFMAEKNITY